MDIATDPQPMLIHTVACALDKDTTGRFKVWTGSIDDLGALPYPYDDAVVHARPTPIPTTAHNT